jgi:hypothetical protein
MFELLPTGLFLALVILRRSMMIGGVLLCCIRFEWSLLYCWLLLFLFAGRVFVWWVLLLCGMSLVGSFRKRL